MLLQLLLLQQFLLDLCLTAAAAAADPCYEIGPDPATGNFAVCIHESSCTTGPVFENSCPSYPADYACCYNKNFPGREHRGVWIASVANIDWPRSPTSSVATHQTELAFLIDQIAKAGLNAVYFQVRPAGDAFYQSDIEPWSVYLTGSQGTAPSPVWDPLQFVIDYCKPRNIEVHAWINPYRASLSPTTTGLADNHMAKQIPECAYVFDTLMWMDPGCLAVQNRTYSVALDLVTRYDLDGLHMDDYFYPYPVTGWTFPDNATYNAYLQSGGEMNIGDWRRDNVNQLVKRLNDGIHRAKPWVKFSLAPFGIYRAGHPEGMPSPPITGFDQYSEIYCDPKRWMLEGWVDILQPQLYWRIEPPQQSYPILLDWWVDERNNPLVRHVNAGLYLTRVDIDNWPLSEIREQIEISRSAANRKRGSWGNIQFSAKMFRDNFNATTDFFKTFIYPYPAFQPVYPWLSNDTFRELENMRPTVAEIKSEIEIRITNEMGARLEGLFYKVGIYQIIQEEWRLVHVITLDKTSANIGTKIPRDALGKGIFSASFINRYGEESEKVFFKVK